jgi:hypothetical protein
MAYGANLANFKAVFSLPDPCLSRRGCRGLPRLYGFKCDLERFALVILVKCEEYKRHGNGRSGPTEPFGLPAA